MDRGLEKAVQAWWDADYSWGGLARKSASVDGATIGLDEIFHDFADELLEADGRKWTPLHLPWFSPDGGWTDAPTGKGGEVSKWLSNRRHPGRCLSGVVSPIGINLPRDTTGPLVADQIILGGGLALVGIDGLRITRARIDGNLRARRCTFAQDVTVFDTEVTGAIDLADCTFERIVDIRKSRVGGRIELSGGRFGGYAVMVEDTSAESGLAAENATIAGDVVLCGSNFASAVTFDGATIVAMSRRTDPISGPASRWHAPFWAATWTSIARTSAGRS